MIRTINIVLLFMCLCISMSYAQPAAWQTSSKQEIMQQYQDACNWLMNTPSYFFKLKYASYKDYVTKEIIESSEGYYKRVTSNYSMEALGIKTVQNSKMKVTIDTANKTVTLMSPASLSLTIADAEQLETMLTNTKALRKIKTSKTSVSYRLDFNKNSLYEAYEFSVNDKGILERLTFYYSEQDNTANEYGQESPEKKGEKMKPRLEILFFGYEVPANYSKSEFEDSWVVVSEKGKVHLTGAYKNYRLLDYRLQSDK